MSCCNNHRKLWSDAPSQDGLKVIVADTLRKETTGNRKPAQLIAGLLDVHENTAASYLLGRSATTLWTAIVLARRFVALRRLIVELISPSNTTLADDLEELRHLQARVENRLREELSHVRPDLPLAGELPQAIVERSLARCRLSDRARGYPSS